MLKKASFQGRKKLNLHLINMSIMSGKVKSIKATRFSKKVNSIMDTELSIVETPLSVKEYDDEGNLIHTANWGDSGMISEKFVYEYENGVRAKQMTYADEDELAETEYYEYDDAGKLIKTVLEYLDGSQDITTHKYNDNNQKLSSITIDDEGDEGQQEFWDYDGQNLVRYRLIDDFGNTEEEHQMRYDDADKLIEKTIINNLHESHFKWTYTYNTDGKLILESRFNAKGKLVEETTYAYDTEGNVIQDKTENAKESLIKEMQYDSNGNETYTVEREDDDGVVLYEVWRYFDDNSRQASSKVIMYAQGESNNIEYEVNYTYEFY